MKPRFDPTQSRSSSFRSRNPELFPSQIYHEDHPNRTRRRTLLERLASDGAVSAPQAQEANPSRYVVRVVSFRCRLLDEDNLAEKYHVDALRYAGVLPSDAPQFTHIEVGQKKVAHRRDEKTVIEIDLP